MTISQEEINQAVQDYVRKMGVEQPISDISFTAGRRGKGIYADIEIAPDFTEVPVGDGTGFVSLTGDGTVGTALVPLSTEIAVPLGNPTVEVAEVVEEVTENVTEETTETATDDNVLPWEDEVKPEPVEAAKPTTSLFGDLVAEPAPVDINQEQDWLFRN